MPTGLHLGVLTTLDKLIKFGHECAENFALETSHLSVLTNLQMGVLTMADGYLHTGL